MFDNPVSIETVEFNQGTRREGVSTKIIAKELAEQCGLPLKLVMDILLGKGLYQKKPYVPPPNPLPIPEKYFSDIDSLKRFVHFHIQLWSRYRILPDPSEYEKIADSIRSGQVPKIFQVSDYAFYAVTLPEYSPHPVFVLAESNFQPVSAYPPEEFELTLEGWRMCQSSILK